MRVLALDIGSSSVKAAVLRNGRVVGKPVRQDFPTNYSADRAEANSADILRAITTATQKLHPRSVDCIALATMSPSWVAMDKRGNAITPVITHQDRRSVEIAAEIEARVGRQRHLRLAGTRPIPGGISSTTCAWFLRHQRSLMRRAALVGHLSTFLHRTLCGTRVVDPSQASFMGVYSTTKLDGWNVELCDAIGLSQSLLPEIREANQTGGRLLPDAARLLGLRTGTPMLAGMIDTGAAMLLAGAKPGQIVNVIGSTDVLALCTDRPKPLEGLLTRALGVGRKWIAAATIAAAGSSLAWAHDQLFARWTARRFFRLVDAISTATESPAAIFDPYLAGDRTAVEQRRASFSGLTLSTTRNELLSAIIHSLARASSDRLPLLAGAGYRPLKRVLVSGGGDGALARIMHRDWPGKWSFYTENEATLRGLGVLAESAT